MTEVNGHETETLREWLETLRRRHFVGRVAELHLFRKALDQDASPTRVLFVYGPAGVGKSTLLDEFASVAARAKACLVRIDGRNVSAAPDDVVSALGDELEVLADDGAIRSPSGRRIVLLVDGYEHLAPVDEWIRDSLLPRLPATAVTVLAGRQPPRPEWRADAAWSDVLRVVSLRNLDPEDTRDYLERRGVLAARRSEILVLAHGHPLTLSLIVDVLARDPDIDLTTVPPDLLGSLLDRLITAVPTPTHQRTLEVSAVARVTTEGLLREVVGDSTDPHALLRWLAELSVTEVDADGVLPLDLVRDLLDADLRWRDPEGYRQVFRTVRAHSLERVRRQYGRPQQRAIADLKFLFRSLRSVVSPVAWEVWGEHYPDRATTADREVVTDIVRRFEGDRSAALAQHWFDRQPEGFHILRGRGAEVRGVVVLLDLERADEQDRAADPGAVAAWGHVERTAPARAGESVSLCRFIVDAEAYQGPSPTLNAVPILTLQRQLTTPHMAWDFVALSEPDQWDGYFAAADLPRAEGADFIVDGCRYGLFAHDFRSVTVKTMTERWTERALADDALLSPATTPEAELLVLSRADFDAAVRQGIKDLHRPDLLASNPLVRTRLVAGADQPGGHRHSKHCSGTPHQRWQAIRGRPALPRAGQDLPTHVAHPRVGGSRARTAVQHLPAAPATGAGPRRRVPVAARAGPGVSRSGHKVTW